jgi:hypothetical protein
MRMQASVTGLIFLGLVIVGGVVVFRYVRAKAGQS